MDVIKAAFGRHGAPLDDYNGPHLRFLSAGYPYSLKFQDTGGQGRANTRAAAERVVDACSELILAIRAAREVAKQPAEPTKINVAHNVFRDYFDDDHLCGHPPEEVLELLAELKVQAEEALRKGLIPSKGRQPLQGYHYFVRGLHALYRDCTGKRNRLAGVYRDGSFDEAPFVLIVAECEVLLPESERGLKLSTIGQRIEAALRLVPG